MDLNEIKDDSLLAKLGAIAELFNPESNPNKIVIRQAMQELLNLYALVEQLRISRIEELKEVQRNINRHSQTGMHYMNYNTDVFLREKERLALIKPIKERIKLLEEELKSPLL